MATYQNMGPLLDGVMTPADARTALGAGSRGWADDRADEISAIVPGLTFDYLKLGQYPAGKPTAFETGVVDSYLTGGALELTTGSGWHMLTMTIQSNPKTSAGWAISGRVKFPALGSGVTCLIAVSDGSDYIGCGVKYIASASKFVAGVYSSATHADVVGTVDADTNWHDLTMVYNGTVATVILDGVTIVANVPKTYFLQGASNFRAIGNGGSLLISRLLYGYFMP